MQTWDDIASTTKGLYEVSDFEVAAYRMVAEQVVYCSDRSSRTAYSLVSTYERNFREVLSRLGVDLKVNRQLRYAYAIPRHGRGASATAAQTIMALVLRGIYDERALRGERSDDGEVFCDFIELGEKYRLMTGRELPGKGEFDTVLRTLARWGIARRLDEQDELEQMESGTKVEGVAIRPAIVDVLGETAIARLTAWSAASQGASDKPLAVQDAQWSDDERDSADLDEEGAES